MKKLKLSGLQHAIKTGQVEVSELNPQGKTSCSQDNWEIWSDNGDFSYGTEHDYIHDLEALGVKYQKSFKQLALERI